VRRAICLTMSLILSASAVFAAGPAGKKQETKALKSADAAFQAGYALLEAGKLGEAKVQFAKAAKLAPELAVAHAAYGAVLTQLDEPKEAIPELEKAIALGAKQGGADPSVAVNLALSHEALGKQLATKDQAEARRQYEAALAGMSDAASQARVQDELGSLLGYQKMWPEAEAAFRAEIGLTPEEAGGHLHLGIVLVEEKHLDDGISELETALAKAPGGMAEFQLGHALTVAGRDEEAVPHLEAAYQATPQPRGAALELAMTEQRMGREEESIAPFRQVVELEPHNAMALTNLGLALTETGKAKEALQFFDRALKEDPQDPVLHEDYGVACLQQSDFDGAIREFEQAQHLDPTSSQLHYDLGLAYKLKDRMDDAVRELLKASELDPTLPDPPYTLGILYMQTGKLDLAVDQLRAALVLRPTNGDGWAILGSVLKQLDRRDEAIEALRKAIALLPAQPGPHLTIAGVLSEQGKHDEAVAERKIAANLSRTAVNRQRASFNTNAGNQALLRGAISEAVGRFQDAIAADPTFVDAHRQLAVALAREGRTDEAAAEQAKAAQLEAEKK